MYQLGFFLISVFFKQSANHLCGHLMTLPPGWCGVMHATICSYTAAFKRSLV